MAFHGSAEEFLHDSQQHDHETGVPVRVLGPAATQADDLETWSLYWHDWLWAMWSAAQEVRDRYAVLDLATFADFEEFAYRFSSALPAPERRA